MVVFDRFCSLLLSFVSVLIVLLSFVVLDRSCHRVESVFVALIFVLFFEFGIGLEFDFDFLTITAVWN